MHGRSEEGPSFLPAVVLCGRKKDRKKDYVNKVTPVCVS